MDSLRKFIFLSSISCVILLASQLCPDLQNFLTSNLWCVLFFFKYSSEATSSIKNFMILRIVQKGLRGRNSSHLFICSMYHSFCLARFYLHGSDLSSLSNQRTTHYFPLRFFLLKLCIFVFAYVLVFAWVCRYYGNQKRSISPWNRCHRQLWVPQCGCWERNLSFL